jgi:hypothetical protein
MSKRTEQRLRARIRELERMTAQQTNRLSHLALQNRYYIGQTAITAKWDTIPEWLRLSAHTAWAAESFLSIHRSPEENSYALRVMLEAK